MLLMASKRTRKIVVIIPWDIFQFLRLAIRRIIKLKLNH